MNAAEKIEPQTAVEKMQPITPIDLLHRAVESGASPEVWEKMMALHERWEANQARKAFDTAIAEAKAKIPVINKNRKVDFTSSRGRTQYSYEDFAEIARTVDPVLGPLGLTYRFRTLALAPDTITVTCRLSHRDGYSEETSLPGAHDTSGNKNSNQALGSTVTYLQRYTLKCALGLAASTDDDGAGGNRVSSGDNYIERWMIFLEDTVSADEIIKKWNAENDLRRKLVWTEPQVDPDRLKDAVMKRRDELKQPADLITQRYKAEDS